MSHIAEEFEQIERERGWNTIFHVSLVLIFMKKVFVFLIETCE